MGSSCPNSGGILESVDVLHIFLKEDLQLAIGKVDGLDGLAVLLDGSLCIMVQDPVIVRPDHSQEEGPVLVGEHGFLGAVGGLLDGMEEVLVGGRKGVGCIHDGGMELAGPRHVFPGARHTLTGFALHTRKPA